MSKELASYVDDFSGWYNDIAQMADLADYSPVRGCMVIKPYGYELWEAIKHGLDTRFKETGHVNAYFPLFIPMSFIEKESKHIEGFAPHLAIVTIGGGKELEEPLVVRPTSETIIGHMYAQWIKSYRDLPVLINQWANVVRWELRTRLFLRTMEFLWQEGHTAHATHDDAEEETLRMLDVYTDFAMNDAAIPVFRGLKTKSETFAGALRSYSIEAMMGDKKALQAGTSHNLGQNFAKAFEIKFLDQNNKTQYCWTTSWGMSTRMVGAIVMVHGDSKGLRLPPVVAPIQVVLIPIYRNDKEKATVMKVALELKDEMKKAGIRSHLDDRAEMTPGFKFNDWEMRGVPIRVEIGPREASNGQLSIARRDKPTESEREIFSRDGIIEKVNTLLVVIQKSLFDQAKAFRDANVHEPTSYESFKEITESGWALAWWCGDPDCESAITNETKATPRCIPLEQPKVEKAVCVHCGKPAAEKVYFAKAY